MSLTREEWTKSGVLEYVALPCVEQGLAKSIDGSKGRLFTWPMQITIEAQALLTNWLYRCEWHRMGSGRRVRNESRTCPSNRLAGTTYIVSALERLWRGKLPHQHQRHPR